LQIFVQEGSQTTDPYICQGLVVVAVEENPVFWKRVGYYSSFDVNEDEGCTFNRRKRSILQI
jgi:hypothetical protein